MKECKCEVKKDADYNPLNLVGGDVVELIGGGGEIYLVTRKDGELRLHALDDGNIWNGNSFMGDGYKFKKVNICFKQDC